MQKEMSRINIQNVSKAVLYIELNYYVMDCSILLIICSASIVWNSNFKAQSYCFWPLFFGVRYRVFNLHRHDGGWGWKNSVSGSDNLCSPFSWFSSETWVAYLLNRNHTENIMAKWKVIQLSRDKSLSPSR